MDNFCAFVLTHGRPNNVKTIDTLKRFGFTGKVYLVVDDEDKTLETYKELYGDQVLVFSKKEVSKLFDRATNDKKMNTVVYARNACWELADQVGCQYFIQLDDDYTSFAFRFDDNLVYGYKAIKDLDACFKIVLDYFKATPFVTIALSQGGDWIGGSQSPFAQTIRTKRKAMNSFFCDTKKKFMFEGNINEDVNVYTYKQRQGLPFLTIFNMDLNQMTTQSQSGGMTEIYKDSGTYVKSFFSLLFAPSCVQVGEIQSLGTSEARLHHKVAWNNVAPKIIRQRYKK